MKGENISIGGEYPEEWMPNCNTIEELLLNKAIIVALHIQSFINAFILVGIVVLVWQYFRSKIAIHPNLKLLFANIILLYFLYILANFLLAFRYLILMLLYNHPCQLLTPIWATFVLYLPHFLYSFAFPIFHFFIMVERFRATFLAEKYENEGIKFGLITTIIMWILSFVYLIYVIFSALADTETFSHPQGILSLMTPGNHDVLLIFTFATIPFVIITPLGDWRISVINAKKKRDFCLQYSLSRNYQLNENALTLRLILPLDVAYACIYSIYLCGVSVIRAYRPFTSLSDYIFYSYLVTTLCFVYILIAVIVYIQFVRFMRFGSHKYFDNRKILPQQNDETNLYFKQLQTQWA